MTFDEYFDKYEGKGIDYDGNYGVQCFDLANDYSVKVVGGKQFVGMGAYEIYTNFANQPAHELYERIPNTPDFVPKKGDIIVWSQSLSRWGHVAVCNGKGDTTWFESFDQNWGGRNEPVTLIRHNYNCVLGVLRPKDQERVLGKQDKPKPKELKGELTSQSPLKFWADGAMLDWRVEGKTSGNLYAIELGDDRWGTLANSQIISRTDGVLQIEMTSETNSSVYALSASAIRQLSDIRNTVSYSFDIRADTDISVLVGYEVQGARAILQVSDEWVTVKFENILFTQSYGFTIVNRSSGGTVYVRNFMLNEGSTALPYEPYGSVGDWDETTQRYKIPVTVNGVTTNLYTDHQLMDGDSIDFATNQTAIPLATGNNVLTVDTAVKPSKVFIKFEG